MGIQPLFKEIFVPDKKVRWRAAGLGGCGECRLYQNCLSPRMPPTGEGRKGILVLAEAPGAEEDRRGTQLIGKSGSRLRAELRELGIDLDRDCRKMNAVNCRPPGNKTPTDIQIACCRARIMQEISRFKPKVILALGAVSMKTLCQHRCLWEYGFPGISQWQGAIIPDQELKCWIVPTYHPAYILRMEDSSPIYTMKWREDLQKVKEAAQGPSPVVCDRRSDVELLLSPSVATNRTKDLHEMLLRQEKPIVAFDYETTGLKPYLDGHKCVCASFGWRTEAGVRALCVPTVEETWPAIASILRDTRIGKCAHNMKFEDLWTRIRGYPALNGFRVQNWEWDSMIAAHILDNRPQYTGLKFQTYINFGVLGYDDDVAPYIRTRQGANAINNIDDAPRRQLFLYCAYDSLFEYLLMEKQRPEILKDSGLRRAYKLMHDGALALTNVETNGIVVDLDYCKTQLKHLTRQIEHLNRRILRYKEVQKWQEMAGKAFNLASPKQLRDLLVKRLGVQIDKVTASGIESVDKTVLENIDLPFVKDLLRIRKLEKIKSTYLSGYLSEAPDGILHPFYHLHKVVSYRGSCSDPNFGHCLEVVKSREFRGQPERPILIRALAAQMSVAIEGATTSTYVRTPKWVEAREHNRD